MDLKKQILNFAFKNIKRFRNMSDTEIYDWICETFYVEGHYDVARNCSFIIFEEKCKLR